MELKTNIETQPITYSEDKPHTISMELCGKYKPTKDTRTFWQKHETQFFNGIMKMMEYIGASSVIWLLMYYLVQWLAK